MSAFLLVCCALACLWIARAATRPFPTTPAPSLSKTSVLNIEQAAPLDHYLDVLRNRPKLFWREEYRSTAPIRPIAEELAAADLSALSVVGIISSHPPQAIVRELSSDRSVTLGIGDEIEGFKVRAIEEDRVELERGGEKFELVY